MSQVFRCLLLIYLCVTALQSHANTIESLMAKNELSLTLTLRTQGELIPQQPVVFAIDVSTKNWFAKGTRLQLPHIDKLVMLPDGEISINSNKQIDGVTWASQIREITLYPLEAGKMVLPAITVNISVQTQQGIVEGQVLTEPMAFEVSLPHALKGLEGYIVSNKVELEQYWSDTEKATFKVGDALTHTLTFTAQDVPAMMLPELSAFESKGLSVYQKPPRLEDKSNRGNLTGKRVDEFNYIFEQPGHYTFTEQRVYWWHSKEQRLVELIIPQRSVSVSGASGLARLTQHSGSVFELLSRGTVYGLIALVVILMLLVSLVRKRAQLLAYYHVLRKTSLRKQQKMYLDAIATHQYLSALQCLYGIHQLPQQHHHALAYLFESNAEQSAILAQLQSLACAAEGECGSTLSVDDAKRLLTPAVVANQVKQHTLFKLNP